MRFIKEFFNRKLKCDRIGHRLKLEMIKIRKRADAKHYRAVVVDYEATQLFCDRCGFKDEPTIGLEVDQFTGCSMPNDMWQEIDKNGYVRIS